MSRIRIGDEIYDAKPLEALPLRHLLTFKADTAALGMPRSWSDIETASAEMNDLPDAEKAKHPEWELVYCAMIWVTLLANGKDIRFRDALEIDQTSIEQIDDPGPPVDPTPGAKKRPTPKASAPAE